MLRSISIVLFFAAAAHAIPAGKPASLEPASADLKQRVADAEAKVATLRATLHARNTSAHVGKKAALKCAEGGIAPIHTGKIALIHKTGTKAENTTACPECISAEADVITAAAAAKTAAEAAVKAAEALT